MLPLRVNTNLRKCLIPLILALLIPTVSAVTDSKSPVTVKILKDPGGRVDWSPDGAKIAFDKRGKDGYFDVWIMNTDGSGEYCLTAKPGLLPQRHNGNPSWHPSGKYIVFQAEKETVPIMAEKHSTPGAGILNDLWIMTADGTRFWKIRDVSPEVSQNSAGVLHPHFSHDGSKLIWSERLRGGGPFGVWAIMTADFKITSQGPVLENIQSLQPVKPDSFYETHGFSGDDTKIIFTANDPGRAFLDIYELELTTKKVKRITGDLRDWDEHAHYRPGGKSILWMSSRGFQPDYRSLFQTEFWLTECDGGGSQKITWFNTPGHPHYLGKEYIIAADNSWSPEGDKLAALLIYQKPDGDLRDEGMIVLLDFSGNSHPLPDPNPSPDLALKTVPVKYRDLYTQLETNLTEIDNFLLQNWNQQQSPLLLATELQVAASDRRELLLDRTPLGLVNRFLDHFAKLGAKAISIGIQYPLFNEDYPRSPDYINFYKQVAKAIKAHQMKVIVELSTSFSDPSLVTNPVNYEKLTFEKFKADHQRMARIIAREIQPDYLILFAEPTTQAANTGLRFDPDRYQQLIENTLRGLPKDGIKIGAGLGSWEDIRYAQKLAVIPELDYIDIHIYPVQKQLCLDKINQISTIAQNSGKTLNIGEAWLYKADLKELAGGSVAAASKILARDTFSFWQPLDQRFIQTFTGLSHYLNMEYINFFWSQMFYAYVEYDQSLEKLTLTQALQRVNPLSYQNMLRNRTSATGKTFSELSHKSINNNQ